MKLENVQKKKRRKRRPKTKKELRNKEILEKVDEMIMSLLHDVEQEVIGNIQSKSKKRMLGNKFLDEVWEDLNRIMRVYGELF